MEKLSLKTIFKEVSDALPSGTHQHITVIGSLAAAYSLFKDQDRIIVHTKDIGCVVVPYISAVENGTRITSTLLNNRWTLKKDGEFGNPGNSETPVDNLPAIRLYPPGNQAWFLELLTAPDIRQKSTPKWTRIILEGDLHYGLPAFPFMSVTTYKPLESPWKFSIARPEMIVLANMLEHPKIFPNKVADTNMKRSNKDLGRALAITHLTPNSELESWPHKWLEALQFCFPKSWKELLPNLNGGISAIINSPEDMSQAVLMNNIGLLSSHRVTSDQLVIEGRRILQVVDDLMDLALNYSQEIENDHSPDL